MVQLLINSKGLQMNPLQSLYYVSPACLICLTIPFGARLWNPSAALYLSWSTCPHSGCVACPACMRPVA